LLIAPIIGTTPTCGLWVLPSWFART
jgi:hypothetical protein